MFCPKCGYKIRDGVTFCGKCGCRIPNELVEEELNEDWEGAEDLTEEEQSKQVEQVRHPGLSNDMHKKEALFLGPISLVKHGLYASGVITALFSVIPLIIAFVCLSAADEVMAVGRQASAEINNWSSNIEDATENAVHTAISYVPLGGIINGALGEVVDEAVDEIVYQIKIYSGVDEIGDNVAYKADERAGKFRAWEYFWIFIWIVVVIASNVFWHNKFDYYLSRKEYLDNSEEFGQ